MSILDRLTDDELKDLLGKRDTQIADLLKQVQFWKANSNYWKNVSLSKTFVIERLREKISEQLCDLEFERIEEEAS